MLPMPLISSMGGLNTTADLWLVAWALAWVLAYERPAERLGSEHSALEGSLECYRSRYLREKNLYGYNPLASR